MDKALLVQCGLYILCCALYGLEGDIDGFIRLDKGFFFLKCKSNLGCYFYSPSSCWYVISETVLCVR